MKQIQTFDLEEWEDNKIFLKKIFFNFKEKLMNEDFTNFIMNDDDFLNNFFEIVKIFQQEKFIQIDKEFLCSVFFYCIISELTRYAKFRKIIIEKNLLEYFLEKLISYDSIHNEFLSNSNIPYYFDNGDFTNYTVYRKRCMIVNDCINLKFSLKELNIKNTNIFSILLNKIQDLANLQVLTYNSLSINILLSRILIHLYYEENNEIFDLSNLLGCDIIFLLAERAEDSDTLVHEILRFLNSIIIYSEYCLFMYKHIDTLVQIFKKLSLVSKKNLLKIFFAVLKDLAVIKLMIIDNKLNVFDGLQENIHDINEKYLFIRLVWFVNHQLSIYKQRKISINKLKIFKSEKTGIVFSL